MTNVATIINFCSHDARFLEHCIRQCRLFSEQIIISVCDHLFDGTPEDPALLERIFAAFPDCLFVQYPYISGPLSPRLRNKVSPSRFWHGVARLVGVEQVAEDVEYLLFLDVDEIPEGERVLQWLREKNYTHYSGLRLASYWYFREARYQALNWEDAALFVRKQLLDRSKIIDEKEREAIFCSLPEFKQRAFTHSDGYPMTHHFSWVRTKQEMLQKVRMWGHRGDRNWEELVEREFSKPFQGTDFVHGYSFQECAPLFSFSEEPLQFTLDPSREKQVKILTEKELLRLVWKSRNSWWDLFSFWRATKFL